MAKAAAASVPSLPLTPPQGLQVVRLLPAEVTGHDLDDWCELDEILGEIADLDARAHKIKDRLRKRLGPGKYTVNGKAAFSIIPNRRFDEEQARRALADYPQVVAALEGMLIDRDKAVEALPDAWYHLCQVEVGDPRVVPARRRR